MDWEFWEFCRFQCALSEGVDVRFVCNVYGVEWHEAYDGQGSCKRCMPHSPQKTGCNSSLVTCSDWEQCEYSDTRGHSTSKLRLLTVINLYAKKKY